MTEQPFEVPVYRNSHFLKLWIAQGISQTAQNATFFALMVFVEERTRSSSHMSALIISTILPAVLFGVAAEVFVDRWNKRLVLISTNALRAVAVLGYLFLADYPVLFYVLNFIFATISQFFLPAEAATIPKLVPKSQLLTANGLFNLTFTASQLAGFIILGPPLVKAFGTEYLLMGIAVSYVVCALLVSRLPNDGAKTEEARRGMFSGVIEEVVAGWRLLTGDLAIRLAMVHLTLVATVTLMLAMLAPGFASRVLGMQPEDTVFMFAPAGAGILLGTYLLSKFGDRFRRLSVVNLGVTIFGSGLLLVAFVPFLLGLIGGQSTAAGLESNTTLLGIEMLIMFFLGFALAMVNIPAQTILQERAPVEMRGRVFAIQLTFGSLASILPLALFGELADLFGVAEVLAVVGAVVLAIAYYSIRETRVIRLRSDDLTGPQTEPELITKN